MSTTTAKFLKRLNAGAVYVTFIEYNGYEANDSADAVYFGVNIQITFPATAAEIKRDEDAGDAFQIELFDEGFVHVPNSPFEFFDVTVSTLTEALQIINSYIRSRPFILIWTTWDTYDLYDPNGQLFQSAVTLHQAAVITDQNFIIRKTPPT